MSPAHLKIITLIYSPNVSFQLFGAQTAHVSKENWSTVEKNLGTDIETYCSAATNVSKCTMVPRCIFLWPTRRFFGPTIPSPPRRFLGKLLKDISKLITV